MTTAFWTDGRVEQMIDLLGKGWSCSHVGAFLGCSRNAVIGKVHRIEAARKVKILRKTISVQRIMNPTRPRKTRLPVKDQHPLPPPASPGGLLKPLPLSVRAQAVPYVPGKPVGILDVTGCRWAVGEAAGVIGRHLFCNADKGDGPYCAHHAEVNVSRSSATVVKRTITAFGMRFEKRRAG